MSIGDVSKPARDLLRGVGCRVDSLCFGVSKASKNEWIGELATSFFVTEDAKEGKERTMVLVIHMLMEKLVGRVYCKRKTSSPEPPLMAVCRQVEDEQRPRGRSRRVFESRLSRKRKNDPCVKRAWTTTIPGIPPTHRLLIGWRLAASLHRRQTNVVPAPNLLASHPMARPGSQGALPRLSKFMQRRPAAPPVVHFKLLQTQWLMRQLQLIIGPDLTNQTFKLFITGVVHVSPACAAFSETNLPTLSLGRRRWQPSETCRP